MNISIKYIVVIALAIGLLSSCSVKTTRKLRTATFMPNRVELHETLDDFEYLGEVEVEVDYSRYIGIFSVIHTINGEPRSNSKNLIFFHGSQNLPITMDRQLNRAIFKAYKAYPDADILMPTLLTKEKQQMFLGSKITKKAKIKAYKLKAN